MNLVEGKKADPGAGGKLQRRIVDALEQLPAAPQHYRETFAAELDEASSDVWPELSVPLRKAVWAAVAVRTPRPIR